MGVTAPRLPNTSIPFLPPIALSVKSSPCSPEHPLVSATSKSFVDAQVLQSLQSSSDHDRKSRIARHSRFNAAEDLPIVREVSAARAHIAPYGATRDLFENAAHNCNKNDGWLVSLTWKQTQDRYTRLQAMFDREARITHARSVIAGGELSELKELPAHMREAREYVKDKTQAQKLRSSKYKEEKEVAGAKVIEVAMNISGKQCHEREITADIASEGSPSTSRRRKIGRISKIQGELAAFSELLRQSDLAHIDFEQDQLSFRREKWAVKLDQREHEREERQEEREVANELELQKMKVLMRGLYLSSQINSNCWDLLLCVVQRAWQAANTVRRSNKKKTATETTTADGTRYGAFGALFPFMWACGPR